MTCRAVTELRVERGRKEPGHCSPLCLTYTFICQMRLTAPDPGTISQQAWRHADCTIFSHPESRHRPMQPSTVICHPLRSSLPFLYLPSDILLSLCHFPLSATNSIHICPRSRSHKSLLSFTVMPLTASFPLHESVKSFVRLNLIFCCTRLPSFFGLLCLSYIFRQAWFSSGTTFLTSSHFLNNMPVHQI